ncbi:hypothetical protein GF385_01870 [Candidatus Dependentiae bacterium]|nr:hypothetical protein [Candidatus Dependentiae bacterium]
MKKNKELWMKFKPLDKLKKKYILDSIFENDKEGLVIKLISEDDSSKLKIIFDGYVVSYRSIDESFYWRSWDLDGDFYIVENSEYVDWLVNKASDFGKSHAKDLNLKHFVFTDQDCIFEVIASYEPIVEIEEA